ncbi:MAG: aminotransferase class I/II-fold pyridoxal phosphate-dependent enzyme, partial [Saprospiraceae bacterium]
MKKYQPETNAIRIQAEQSSFQEHAVPLYLSSSFTFGDAEEMRATFADEQAGYVYSRYANPNTEELIQKMCVLEGADDGIATASGMAAVFESLAGLLSAGDHIVASRAVFGSTHQILTQILTRWGIKHTYVSGTNIEEWASALTPATKIFLCETPSNPGLDIIDINKLSVLSKAHNIILNIDNCFATPYIQQPIPLGADLVTHSATKYIDGQGRVLGGLVLGRQDLIDKIRFFHRHTGPSMSAFNAWILSKSLETLSIRMDKHCSNAMEVANFLGKSNRVKSVIYPHLPSHPQYDIARKQMKMGGGIVSFELEGGISAGKKFLDAVRMFSLTANL